MLARLCSIPTNDLAMARIVLLREVAHSAAPVLQRPPIEVLGYLHAWLAGRAGPAASAAQSRDQAARHDSAGVLPNSSVPSRTTPYHPERLITDNSVDTGTRTTHQLSMWSSLAKCPEDDRPGRTDGVFACWPGPLQSWRWRHPPWVGTQLAVLLTLLARVSVGPRSDALCSQFAHRRCAYSWTPQHTSVVNLQVRRTSVDASGRHGTGWSGSNPGIPTTGSL
jgi:hypothetical protein